jgi:predicted MFS family arabinose efflux permease
VTGRQGPGTPQENVTPPTPVAGQVSERAVVFLIGAVQFVNILDFMMVMPLGPDFAAALGIPVSHLGFIGGAYTAAAAVSGLAGSFFLDRFDRRSALALAMLGLVLGTAAGGFATGMATLMAARIVAGAFGGPATSISLSIIADVIPPERRGKAMGAVMGAFAVASVLGVPLGLELSARGGWRLPFFAVAGLGLLINVGALFLLPPMRGHLANRTAPPRLLQLLSRGDVLLSYGMTWVAMMAGFILIPNLSAFVQNNLGYPRARLGLLYLSGGIASFATMRVIGPFVDKVGSTRVAAVATVVLAVVIYFGFAHPTPVVPIVVFFVAFMVAMSSRNVAYNTLTSKVPGSGERARFMSIQSSVQHLASAIGAFLAARLLTERPDGSLEGMTRVALISIALMLAVPVMMALVEARVRRRGAGYGATAQPQDPQTGIGPSGPGIPRARP